MTPAEIARAAAERLFKLPIQNTEHAHGEKDELHRMMVHLAERWEIPASAVPTAANDNVDMSAIAVGERQVGSRTVQVETRTRRVRVL